MIHRYIIEATDEVKGFEEAIERLDREWGIEELDPCEDALSRAYIEPIIEELENICVNGDKHILNLLADIKNAPSVTPRYTNAEIQKMQEMEQAEIQKAYEVGKASQPKTGYISIDDVMSVFDDFMCGEVDEDGTDTFLEMLKDKAESEAKG